ncbi:MAG: bis(5'-nucleosyl)-tetraphosphatase (symmetrical) YqeK [Clostridia bacterium]|nr:bis(5'-nucleosyl)-tetraphosphatase (symmetrical) YqeK [Clostridia bacterium]MBR5447365.1 bis(5'-nucleosyl)-tetraphosphatase (symmetrical) YqeK [Clostridia bacterium]MBR5632460.1 bis(5'-nucleosyl)-tetraphosphatase (symmetrical) YqeK [Clostridia bacterium]
MDERVYTEEDIVSLREQIRPYLTEKRYGHTLAVEREAEYLGEIYMPEKVMKLRAAALLHDITKMCVSEKQLQYCSEFGIITSEYDILAPKTLHAKTAAALVGRDFPLFDDAEITDGVRWHTTGRDAMSVFEAIIYLADYIEDTRTFPDCVELRRYFREAIASGEDKYVVLYRTMVKSFDMTMRNLLEDGKLVCEDTVRARNHYVTMLIRAEKLG